MRKVDFHLQARGTQGPYSYQWTLELRIRNERDILKRKTPMQNDAIGIGR